MEPEEPNHLPPADVYDEGGPITDEPVTVDSAWEPPQRVRLRKLDLAVLALILAATALTFFARLSQPGPVLYGDSECTKFPPLAGAACHRMIPLDEVHYIPDARDVVRFGTESDTRITGEDGAYVVHPPVAKWFIAEGIRLFGDRPFGWRFFSAVFGTFGVLFLYLIALRLWRSPWWAAMAAALLAMDGLWFVQSRIAMLDIYVASFFLLGVWLLLKDRDRMIGSSRVWRALAGVAFGFALASKLEIVWMFFFAIALSALWDRARPDRAPGARSVARRAAMWAIALVVIPSAVYMGTYTPWFVDSHRYSPPRCEGHQTVPLIGIGGPIGNWVCYQREVLDFHKHLAKYDKGKPAHPYFGNGYAWPWIGRPVAHYYRSVGTGTTERRIEVLGLPNPFIWWPAFFIGFPFLAWWTFRRKDRVAPVILAFFIAGFAPNALFDVVRRPVFLFYATPLVPWLVLTVVHLWHRLCERAPGARLVAYAYVLGAAMVFAYFYPVLSGWPLGPNGLFGWLGHMWENGDCIGDKIKQFCWI